ncbi:MAG: glycosyltransferase [Pseudomonadota bacterium]
MKTDYPKVSVGVMAYNHEEFIEECLDSIRNQNYPNLELIVSDDGSKDKTRDVVRSYQKKYPDFPFEFVEQPENLGIANNCNFLLDKMTGKYGHCFAGDDLFLPGKIQANVECLERNPQAIFCFSNMEWFSSDTGKRICDHFGFVQKPSVDLEEYLKDNTIPSPAIFLRLKEIKHIRYNPEVVYINDFLFIVELLLAGKGIYQDQVLVRYRKHKKSLTATNYFYDDRIKILEIFRKIIPSKYSMSLRHYNDTVKYAEIMTLIQKGFKAKAAKQAILFFPKFFKSPKWFLRGGLVLKKIIAA